MSKTSIGLFFALVIVIAFNSDKRLIGQYLNSQHTMEVLEPSFQHVSMGAYQKESGMDNKSTAQARPMHLDANLTTRIDPRPDQGVQFSTALSNTTQTSNGKPPTKFYLKKSFVRFLHMGKAGGGTIAIRLRKLWKLQIHQCHPWPCIEKKWKQDNVTGKQPYMLLSLRDPVDRFVSAFYWRILKICHPEADKRIERPNTLKQPCLEEQKRSLICVFVSVCLCFHGMIND